MRTRREFLLQGAAAVCATAAWPASTGAAESVPLAKRGTLKVLAVDESLFFSLEQRPLPGFDREVLEEFAHVAKIPLGIVHVPGWDQMIPWLNEGKGDLIAGGYSVTEARRKVIDFSAEVFPSRKAVMTRKPNKVITTLEQLRLEKVGTVKGTSMAEAVAAAGVPESHVVYFPTGTLPAAMKAGKCTAVVLGVEHCIPEIRMDPDVQLGLFLGTPGSLAFGVRKGDVELQRPLDVFLENLKRTPTYSRLIVKYLGQDAPEILRKAKSA